MITDDQQFHCFEDTCSVHQITDKELKVVSFWPGWNDIEFTAGN